MNQAPRAAAPSRPDAAPYTTHTGHGVTRARSHRWLFRSSCLNDLHESGVTSGGIDPREVSAMDGNVWRPAHLMPEQLEERRLAAARLLRQGRLSQAEIARQ